MTSSSNISVSFSKFKPNEIYNGKEEFEIRKTRTRVILLMFHGRNLTLDGFNFILFNILISLVLGIQASRQNYDLL